MLRSKCFLAIVIFGLVVAELYPAEAQRGRKNPTLGAVGSAVVPGLGQLYAGETSKGIKFFVAEAATSVFLTIAASKRSEIRFRPVLSGVGPPARERDPYGVGVPIQMPKATHAAPQQSVYEETNRTWQALTIASAVVLTGLHVYNVFDSYQTVQRWNEGHGFTALDVELDNHGVTVVVRHRF